MKKNLSQTFLRLLMVLLVLPMAWVNAWGYGGSQTFHATSAEPAKGLVYANNSASANPTISNYTSPSAAATVSNDTGEEGMAFASYAWAMPARGYKFVNWTGDTNGNTAPSGETYNNLDPATDTGSGDKVTTTVPRKQTHHGWAMANFATATGYNVVYKQPEGGEYTVKYEYYTVNESTNKFKSDGETLQLTPTSGDKRPTDPRDANDHKTYKADKITLTATEGNFIAWYKDGVELSKSNPYTGYEANADAEISALYQYIVLGEADGDLTVNATAKGAYNRTIYVNYSQKIGTWSASDFTIVPKNPDGADASNDYGTIEFGSISIDETNNRLVIPYTYTATDWGGISVDVTVAPPVGAGAETQFTIAAYAEEVVAYEACIEESGVRTYTGSLSDMMTQANSMNNKPTLKLMQNMAITTPLSFTQSFTFDVNGKVLTANCASAFSIDAAGIDVKIIDGSFTQVGEIHTSHASNNAVSVVTFTNAAKLTMQGGTLSVENTGLGAAYGVDVRNGSIFYMTGGDLTVTASSGDARGANIATVSDYATFNGGSMTISAPTNAYGIWSAGQSNITNAAIIVNTTGSKAYGMYVNGGTITATTINLAVNANTTESYGAYVNAGRLNGNGGSFAASAVTDKAYGVHVAAGATAMLQQKATVSASITTGNGSNNVEVCGINNLGTVSLYNISVTANSATNYATAVNTKTSAISTTIDGGSYTAQAATHHAYGLHHQYGALSVDGGTFKAITVENAATGVFAAVDATIANATMSGETTGTGTTAYGFVGGEENKNIALTNCTIKAKSNTSTAYAIYSRANVTATDCALEAQTGNGTDAKGFHAEKGANSLVNCNATVSAHTISAYGVHHVDGTLSIDGGVYNVKAKQDVASAEQSANAYGLYNASGKTTTAQNATFIVTSGNNTFSKDVYGAYINGVLISTGCLYDAQAKLNAFGVFGNTASTLTLENNTINSTTKNGTASYGIHAKKNFSINGDVVNAVGSSTDVYAMYFASTSNGDVLNGKFSAQGNGTNGYGALNAAGTKGNVRLKGGVYKTTINLQKYVYTGYQIYHLDGTHPDYADGFRYTIATENPSPYVCRIVNGAYYATLEAALQYTLDNSGNYTIVMTQNYTLPAGDYVLPANATLIVPRKFGQTTITETPSTSNPDPAQPDKTNSVGLREEFMRLTIAKDAHINVNGKIGVSGEMYCQESGYISYNNSPYGCIYMEEGSLIQLNNGARLYAWGFISGTGNIIVKSNAEVHEMFQVGDMQTVGNLADGYYGNSQGHFLINQYCIHNVEAPTTYYHNSRLICAMYNYYKGTSTYQGGHNIPVVGTSGSLFEVTSDNESSWVRKTYDAASDMQVWDVNGSAQLGSIEMTIASYSINSLDYILPITSNMKIHILDGDFKITQSTEFLPGSQIEIDKTASLTIKETYKNSSKQTKNLKVYVFDKDQWPLTTSSCSPVYSPAWPNGSKPSRTAGDAAINVHGNINIEGALFTSNKGTETSKTDGANIFSTNEDAGTISLENAAPNTTTSISLITGVSSGSLVTKAVTMDPAKLKNGTGASQAYTPTSGTDAGHAFAYINNEWQETYTNGCFEVIGTTVYAKPSGYVALKKTQEVGGLLEGVEEANHTYLTADDKILIIVGDCQWWEVEPTSNPTVFECKKTGYEGFYYYDEVDGWVLKTVEVKFYAAETGEEVLKTITTDYNGVPNQAVIATNPTKVTTDAATYQFYGWKSSVTGTEYPWTATLEVATADMSYRPVFTETKRNYTVTLIDANNGAAVPLEVPYGETPEYTPVKETTAQYTYTFSHWDPALATVTGPGATYTAKWDKVTNRYTITWQDGQSVLETDKNQLFGATTTFNKALPTKETDNNFVYTFSGWRSSMTGQTYANGSTPTVAGETTYEAQFSTTPRYVITFNNYDGTELQKESVTAGEHPIYNGLTPGRARDLDGYFKFIGWKNSDGDDFAPNATLPAVTGKETYTAQYDYVTELYLITLNNVDGNGASWSGKFGVGSTPFYDPNNDDVADMPVKASTAQYEYPFEGWNPELEPVSGEATYTAQFGQNTRSYTITFANLDGNGKEREVTVEYGQIPVCPETPIREEGVYSWAFKNWSPGIAVVTGDATYTAVFESTPTVRKFDITFDPENGEAPYVLQVEYNQMPTPADPVKAENAQYNYSFAGWYPTLEPVTEETTYNAQYVEILRSYTIRFENWDGTELQSSTMTYGATPTPPSNPTKPVNMETMKAYTFSGWSPAIATVTGAATYTAQYNEVDLVASVTTASNETFYYGSWSSALSAANSSANCTLRLYQNVTAPVLTKIDQNMTIDLNGCTLSCTTSSTSDNRFIWVNKVALIIDDSKGGGKIYFEGTGNKNYNAIRVDGVGSLTVRGGTIQAHATNNNSSSAAYAVLLYNNSTTQGTTLNMYGGELIASHTRSARTASSVYFNGTNYVNVYGGKLKGKNSIFNNNNTANRIVLRGGYYSMDPGTTLTIPSGYAKVATTEIAGYTYKVAPVVYTITLNKGTHGRADGSATVDFSATELKTFTPVTAAGYDCTGYFYGELKVLNADGTFAGENVTGYITDGKWSKAANCTLTAKWNLSSILEANDGENISVSETAEVDDIIVHEGGAVNIETGVAVTAANLILEASSGNSGQLTGSGTINVTGKVYFDLILNTDARHWHAFGVPWNVDVTEYPAIELETGRTLTIGRDYEIVSYNGATRASQGAGAHCWDYLKHYSEAGQPVDVMTPGKGYMIALTRAIGTVRFTKATGAPIFFEGENSVTGGAGEDGGWNAIANPMAYHATLASETPNSFPTVGYVHDGGEIGSDGYTPYDINGKKYIVGKMVYVQAASDQTIVVNPAGSAGEMTVVSAPKRRAKATDKQYLSLSDYYTVSLTNADGEGNKVYILPEEDKANEYVIGHDLSQFSMSNKKAQIWVDRYDTKLALNTTAPIADVAEFPVSLYAPVAGEYTITNTFVPDDEYIVYLTLDGEAIWNLSDAAYTITLDKGTVNNYGLRLNARKAPSVATGIDEAVVDAKGETRKVMINDQVYIIRGENVYSVDGQLVK